MLKKSIEWHEECLRNSVNYHSRERERLESLMENVIQGESRDLFYAEQIDEAKRRGLKEFDKDRLLIPKNKNHK